MLKNACLLAKIGADTAENERNLPIIFQKNGNYLIAPPASGSGPRVDPLLELAEGERGPRGVRALALKTLSGFSESRELSVRPEFQFFF